ncbi:RrF2 family transcriptional regulator [Armatimonas sp.]|uniref:RrF2 family transcriptional regulator n=1 Tax=Armatimonas sp. TaxID=1872638 RepID=UPI003751CDC1
MFTFTKKTDYALLALCYLATESTERLTGPREIAQRYEIPAELLAKVMQTLAKRQLILSVPGPTGGYRLGREAAKISIAEIVEATDGPLAIAQCWEEAGLDGCQQSRNCHLRGPLAQIQEQMAEILRQMTLADLLTPEPLRGRRFVNTLPLVMAQK